MHGFEPTFMHYSELKSHIEGLQASPVLASTLLSATAASTTTDGHKDAPEGVLLSRFLECVQKVQDMV